jgi:hypothetical protein
VLERLLRAGRCGYHPYHFLSHSGTHGRNYLNYKQFPRDGYDVSLGYMWDLVVSPRTSKRDLETEERTGTRWMD